MNPDAKKKAPSFWQFLVEPVTIKRALKISTIVGTLLNLINQGDLILAGHLPVLWKVLLTYCIPYAVSSYSTAALLAEQARSNR